MYKNFTIFGFILVALTMFLSVPGMSNAALELGLEYGAETGLETTDPRTITAKVINTTLTLLGTITLVLIIYGGFLWMTAAGNDENVKKAKSIMVSGIIGLAIVLSAYAISYFVIEQLAQSTVE